MARLWSSGFELNSTTAAVEWSFITGMTIGTSTVRTGTYAGTITAISGTAIYAKYVFANLAATKNIYTRFYIRFGTLPNATSTIFGIGSSITESSALLASNSPNLRVTSTGAIGLFNGTTQIGSNSSALLTNTWYRVEVHYDSTAAAGSQTLELLIDGVSIASSSALTITTASVASLYFGSNLVTATTDSAGVLFFDDIAINDSSGSFQNTYPGSGGIIHLRPNADGDSHQWNTVGPVAGTANNFLNVDEITPNDVTDVVEDPGITGNVDYYNIDNPPAGIGTINVVAVGTRQVSESVGLGNGIAATIKASSGGTTEDGSTVTPSGTTWRTNTTSVPRNYQLTTYDLPGASTTAWTSSDLTVAQIGVKEVDIAGAATSDVSTVWMLVDFIAVATIFPSNDVSFYNHPTSLPSSHYTKPIIEMY